jgi:glucose/arabinose dehydrogenase
MHRFVRYICHAVAVVAAVLAPSESRADSLAPAAAQLFLPPTLWSSSPGEVTDFRFLPDGRAVIVEKTGAVRIRTANGSLLTAATLPVDSEGEKGLLAVEVDPAFAVNGFLYVFWSVSNAAGGTDLDRHRVSRFTLETNDVLDLQSELVLVKNLQGTANPGGGLAIGPDGRLYIGAGDGGCNSGQPPGEGISNWFGTCLTNGNGKILRVNLDGTIPSDNPLFDRATVTACGSTCDVIPSSVAPRAPRKEIWAWGLRNPRRISFDPMTGNLWVGDEGEVTHEELNIVRKGEHLGWPFREGAAGQPVTRCSAFTPESGDCVDPVYFCRHDTASGSVDGDCRGITGGVFVDSCTWPEPWRGRHFFGDERNGLGRIWALSPNEQRDGVVGARVGFATLSSGTPSSFRVGPDGNLYVAVSGIGGRILRITPISPEPCAEPDAGGEGDAGNDGGRDRGGGTTGIGGVPVPERPPASACSCSVGAEAVALLSLLALARALLSRRGR